MGGILIIFGAAVYILISLILLNQVDDALAETVQDILNVTRVNSIGQVNAINLPPLDLTANTYVQVWGRDGKLKSSSPGISSITQPLDPVGLKTKDPVYRENTVNGVRLRVLTVPLEVGEHKLAILQVATSLTVVDSARGNLIRILAFAALVAVFLTAVGSWFVLGSALAPLPIVTETVQVINRADDLSRRVPYTGPPDDEVGSLIEAINQTLERL